MKVKVPTELMVMGKKVRIEYKRDLKVDGELVAGSYVTGDNTIRVGLSQHDSYDGLLSTIQHELVHYVLAKSGVNNHLTEESEEAIAVAIEENLLPLMRMNRRKWRKPTEVYIGNLDRVPKKDKRLASKSSRK